MYMYMYVPLVARSVIFPPPSLSPSLPLTCSLFLSERNVSLDSHDFVLSTAHLRATFSGSTGMLRSLQVAGTKVAVEMDVVIYKAFNQKNHRAGAYLFVPVGEASSLLSSQKLFPVTIVSGPLV